MTVTRSLPDAVQRIIERISRRVSAGAQQPSARVQRLLLAGAAALFVVGGWFAFRSLDVSLERVQWPLLAAVAVVGVPLTLLATTLEYLLSARMLNHRVAVGAATRLTIISTAANLLPLPGAFLVRVQALRAMGSRYSKAMGSTAIIGLVWIGVSALLAGSLLAPSGRWVPALGLWAAGGPILVVAYAWLCRTVEEPGERRRIAALAVAVELFAVLINAARLVLILIGLGIDASVGQTLVLAVSSSLAAAAGILPGGFGLREVIAAALAPLVGLPASAGFAATALNRLIALVALAPVTAILSLRPPADSEPAARVADDLDGDLPRGSINPD